MVVRILIILFAPFLAFVALAQGIVYGSPSILPQCIDPNPQTGVGPSARARECTRLYCARPEYREGVEAYAMRRRQSEEDQKRAL